MEVKEWHLFCGQCVRHDLISAVVKQLEWRQSEKNIRLGLAPGGCVLFTTFSVAGSKANWSVGLYPSLTVMSGHHLEMDWGLVVPVQHWILFSSLPTCCHYWLLLLSHVTQALTSQKFLMPTEFDLQAHLDLRGHSWHESFMCDVHILCWGLFIWLEELWLLHSSVLWF